MERETGTEEREGQGQHGDRKSTERGTGALRSGADPEGRGAGALCPLPTPSGHFGARTPRSRERGVPGSPAPPPPAGRCRFPCPGGAALRAVPRGSATGPGRGSPGRFGGAASAAPLLLFFRGRRDRRPPPRRAAGPRIPHRDKRGPRRRPEPRRSRGGRGDRAHPLHLPPPAAVPHPARDGAAPLTCRPCRVPRAALGSGRWGRALPPLASNSLQGYGHYGAGRRVSRQLLLPRPRASPPGPALNGRAQRVSAAHWCIACPSSEGVGREVGGPMT